MSADAKLERAVDSPTAGVFPEAGVVPPVEGTTMEDESFSEVVPLPRSGVPPVDGVLALDGSGPDGMLEPEADDGP